MWDHPVCQLPPCCHLFVLADSLHLPSSLDEYFYFYSMAVGLPYSSIFWQFWFLGFLCVFKLFFLLLVVWGSEAYLSMTPSGPGVVKKFFSNYSLRKIMDDLDFSSCYFLYSIHTHSFKSNITYLYLSTGIAINEKVFLLIWYLQKNKKYF